MLVLRLNKSIPANIYRHESRVGADSAGDNLLDVDMDGCSESVSKWS